MFRIRGDPPAFDEAVLNEILQTHADSFTTVRQFLLDTPTRAQVETVVGHNGRHDASDDPNGRGGAFHHPYTPQFPNSYSPLLSDLIHPYRTLEDGSAPNGPPLTAVSPIQAFGAQVLATGGCRTVPEDAACSSSGVQPENALTPLSNYSFSLSDASPTSDILLNNVPSSTASTRSVTSSPAPSTPASTPPSAHRACLNSAPSREQGSHLLLENPDTNPQLVVEHGVPDHVEHDSGPTDRGDQIIDEVDDQAGDTERESSNVVCTTTNAMLQGDTPSAVLTHDTHVCMRLARKRKRLPDKAPNKGKYVKVSGPKPIPPRQLQDVPSHVKQPDTLLNEIRNHNHLGQGLDFLIQKSFYGFGHPKWFGLLRDACCVLRREDHQWFPTSDGSLAQSYRLVSDLKNNELLGRIMRRYGLVDLVNYRNGCRESQRASHSVLTHMLREARPELRTAFESSVEFQDGLKTLRQELKRGRHWYALTEKFGSGVLAIVPAQPLFGISNTR